MLVVGSPDNSDARCRGRGLRCRSARGRPSRLVDLSGLAGGLLDRRLRRWRVWLSLHLGLGRRRLLGFLCVLLECCVESWKRC